MFLGRKNELTFLESLYNSNELHCVCLEGAIGIGKTALLQELSKRRSRAYFCVRSCTENANKAAFLAELSVQGLVESSCCKTWDEALQIVLRKACGEKMLLLIDDVQELSASFKSFLPVLLRNLQENVNRLRLLVIFSGRDVSVIHSSLQQTSLEVTLLQLKALSYEECLTRFTPFSNDEKVLLYGVTGGAPRYLQYIDENKTFKENLYELFYAPSASMVREGENILNNIFRQPHIYHAVLCSVACGAIHMKDIAEAVGMSVNKVSKYVKVLLQYAF